MTRRGIGLLWNPEFGTLIQSQTGSSRFAWGTRRLADDELREAANLEARFSVGETEKESEPGVRDLPEGSFEIEYDVWGGTKRLEFGDGGLSVGLTERSGDSARVVEQIPLLLMSDDTFELGRDRVSVVRDGRTVLQIRISGADSVSAHEGGWTVLDRRGRIGSFVRAGNVDMRESAQAEGLRLVAVHLETRAELSYELELEP